MRIGYLVSRYPALTHAFLEREVAGMRDLGVEVETISIRPASEREPLCERAREEARRTHNVLPAGPLRLIAAHGGALIRGPLRYLSTLGLALRLGEPGVRGRLYGLFYFAEAMLVRRHCRRRAVRHLHATQFADGAGTVALLASHGGRECSWSLTVHGPGEFYEVERHRLAEKVRRAAFMVAVSEFTRSQLMALVEERHWDRIRVIHMGVDLERYPLRRRPPREGADARVLTVARLVPQKGHPVLLRALARLREEGLALSVTIAGGGEGHDMLVELARKLGLEGQVRFLGAVSQRELPGLYADADIFCLPTLAEAVGVVNMEAMATGLPVISSALMGVPELVENGVSGLLVTPGSDVELAAALRRLAADPALRQRMGEAGRRMVEAEFDAAAGAADLRDALGDYA